MKLYQIRYFSAVCRCGYVTKAAEELHVSQPSVSNAVRDLEDEFGVNLFHRINNRLTPTKEGVIFLDRVSKILDLADETASYIGELGQEHSSFPGFSGILKRKTRRYNWIWLKAVHLRCSVP